MADVYAIFGTLLALGIAFPGMLAAWWLLFPGTVEMASARVARTPWKTFGLGLVSSGLALLPVFVLFALSAPFTRFLGTTLLFAALAFAGMGAAGIALHMGEHLQQRMGNQLSKPAAFVRGAIALELAAAFPFIGWLLVIPLTIITSMGAATFAVLRWAPKPRPQATKTEMAGAAAEA